MYLLDTNVCIDLIRKNDTSVSEGFLSAVEQGFELVISTITQFELELGVRRCGNKAKERAALDYFLAGPLRVIDFNTQASRSASDLCTHALAQGRQLSAYDGLIAGHAIALDAILVTSDTRLAAAVSEVEVISWR
jgi:tRNA(fMet)-specific endonuclease VapC